MAEKPNASRANGNKKRAGSVAQGELALPQVLAVALRLLFLQGGWMICSSCLHFPVDGKELWAQPRIGLAWQRVAGLFFECSRGNRL